MTKKLPELFLSQQDFEERVLQPSRNHMHRKTVYTKHTYEWLSHFAWKHLFTLMTAITYERLLLPIILDSFVKYVIFTRNMLIKN